jgi:hypothetical protein
VQSSFESIEEASSEDDIIGVKHVDDIKNDVFCVRVSGRGGGLPNDTGRVMILNGSIHFLPKP